ncbi:glycoside hydrolase superfamily [Fomes fomentarius]|nr:glycoside hydrolase superfamily [Fomes fomentarius]
MKLSTAFLALAAAIAASTASPTLEKRAAPKGIDISHYQPSVNFNTVKANGLSFVYIKATEGTTYTDPSFSSHYVGATNAGLIRGDNPSGAECYGLSASAMVSWIKDFSNTYHAATGVYPVIYSTTDWWKTCTGNSAAFASTNPLWVARYASSIGALPAGWSFATFWQYADSGPNPGDQDEFNGSLDGLKKIALG